MVQKDLKPEEISHFGLNIFQFGHEVCHSGHSFGPAVRQHYLLHYVINGTGRFFTERGSYQINPGEAFLIYPHEITTYSADKRQPWEYMWIEFDGLIVARTFESCGLSRDNPVYSAAADGGQPEAFHYLQQILAQETAQSLRIAGLTCLFLDALQANAACPVVTRPAADDPLEKAIHWMERNYHENITISDIAACCRVDRSYLSRLFKARFGYGPKHYLILLRMNVATSLLVDARLPIKVIAFSVGYRDQMQFSRVFRQIWQMSPGEWRRQGGG
ncbi:AraC family transcriptional regulator of arabinose operon [Erwinia toletana]|uniref:AraC family transcriptional regulator of arabinose operon n=1 Tax=Winslowiella toletana TaxID=92490 RepID=A0ABS4PCB9_9GAMM|nr:AraC family transcriptional regulator [Winslowiella toletana]MBP2170262.1 AraC family transcriptional regulator of arabinose operon [Winslowiella toletana]